MLVQALLVGLIAAIAHLDYQLGTLYMFRPIVTGPLVGLVLGDVQKGLEIGVSLELLFMGAISVGAYIPPDVIVGGVLGAAFAITMGKSTDAAIALAMPIAVISVGLENILNAVLPFFLKIADKGAAEGKDGKIVLTHWIMGGSITTVKFLMVFGAFYLGADQMENLLGSIPTVIIDGMGVAAGILPSLGFAMLMRMIINKKLVPFYFLGFILSAYVNIPVLGVAAIGIIIAVEKFHFLDGNMAVASGNVSQEVCEDDDF